MTRSFDVFFDLRPNKQLSKHSWGWWFETLSCSLWRHCNVSFWFLTMYMDPRWHYKDKTVLSQLGIRVTLLVWRSLSIETSIFFLINPFSPWAANEAMAFSHYSYIYIYIYCTHILYGEVWLMIFLSRGSIVPKGPPRVFIFMFGIFRSGGSKSRSMYFMIYWEHIME